MDEAVKTIVATLLALCTGAAAVAAPAVAAPAGEHAVPPSAQGLQDPTRPPAVASAAPASVDAAQAAPQLPQLQSVLVGTVPGARRIAVIDGETVRVGESFHGARVLRIADNEVELQRGRARQVLRLYAPEPGAGMTRVAPAAHRQEKGER